MKNIFLLESFKKLIATISFISRGVIQRKLTIPIVERGFRIAELIKSEWTNLGIIE